MLDRLVIRSGRTKFLLFYAILLSVTVAAQLLSSVEEQGSLYEPAYVAVCLLMGLALGLDVMVATIARFQSLRDWSMRFMWAFRTAVGHTICPLVGVLTCFWLASLFDSVERVIGFAGFALILFIYGNEVRELCRPVEALPEDNAQSTIFPALGKVQANEWALAFAVSIDSLLSGSTQGAQRTGWTMLQATGSFIYVGLVVGILGVLAACVASQMYKSSQRLGSANAPVFAMVQLSGFFLELAVVGYFGWHALLVFGLNVDFSWLEVSLCSLGAAVVFFALFGKKMWRHHIAEAQSVVSLDTD